MEEWLHMLNAPLPGASPRKATDAEVEAEGASFMNAMATLKPGA